MSNSQKEHLVPIGVIGRSALPDTDLAIDGSRIVGPLSAANSSYIPIGTYALTMDGRPWQSVWPLWTEHYAESVRPYDLGHAVISLGAGASVTSVSFPMVFEGWEASQEDAATLIAASDARLVGAVDELADRLEIEVRLSSVVRRAARSPAFVKLAASGTTAIVTALRRLTGDLRPLWLFFLQRVVDDEPATGCPSIADAAEAWRQWGYDKGLL
jgi:hypothetical protein